VRGDDGYEYRGEDADREGAASAGRLHILEVQRLIRHIPKPVVCVVPGWAVGGGHSLHVVCDLTLASEDHAKFLQTDPDVASFDAGFGSAYLARQVGQKKAREIFFLGKTYDAAEAADMGMVNEAVPHEDLEDVALEWAERILSKSPMATRMLKYAFNMADDGMVGQQVFAGEATRLGYMTDEAAEGRDAFNEGREPDFDEFDWHY
jgi:naphthoate synthase